MLAEQGLVTKINFFVNLYDFKAWCSGDILTAFYNTRQKIKFTLKLGQEIIITVTFLKSVVILPLFIFMCSHRNSPNVQFLALVVF
jgi:hypothetical protein